MPRMHCMGTSVEIPASGKICPKLPTNMVPSGTKCEVVCESGSPSVEFIKCDADGWTAKEVSCSGSSAGLIVGLLVGGVIIIVIIAYVYAKMKTRKQNKADANLNNKNQPMSRAAKIAARNDMMVTGVVTKAAVHSGLVKPASTRKTQGKLVTGAPDQTEYRHHSSSSQMSNPPSYHSNDPTNERSHNSTPTSKSHKSRRSRNSNGEYPPTAQRKPRPYYDEYTEEVDLGYHEGLPAPNMDGQYHTTQENGPMYPDYYGPGVAQEHHRYGAMDHSYYRQEVGAYPDQYLNGGVDNMVYSHTGAYQKPYRVPI